MAYQHHCPQCLFISQQLARRTPCLLHADGVLAAVEQARATEVRTPSHAYDEPYSYGSQAPTADRPGPFSLREYARLLALRGRLADDLRVRRAGA